MVFTDTVKHFCPHTGQSGLEVFDLSWHCEVQQSAMIFTLKTDHHDGLLVQGTNVVESCVSHCLFTPILDF